MLVKASDAIGLAMYNADAKVATYVPGIGVTEIYYDYCHIASKSPTISFHEEVAYTVAHGAALAGKRAFTVLKAHGFAKAGNSITDSLYSGTSAGLIVVAVDDINGIQSDCIMDTPSLIKGIGIPHKAADVENIYEDVINGFEISKRYHLPYALIIDASDVSKLSRVPEQIKRCPNSQGYQRNIAQHVLCPPFCRYQRDVLGCKLQGGTWTQIPRPIISPIPESLPEKWKPVARSYDKLFDAFKSIRGPIVAGDTGISTLFALPHYDCIDVTTYMGGSLPLAIGFLLAGFSPAWAVTGDFSFIAAGHIGLLEAVQRKIPLKVLLLYNGIAETTGGQRIPEGTLERILKGYEKYVSYIRNPRDRGEVKDVLKKAACSNELNLVVANFR